MMDAADEAWRARLAETTIADIRRHRPDTLRARVAETLGW